MERLEYELEFITPAFIGGAEPNFAELRPASVMGMLRYWFRIITGAFVQRAEDIFKLEGEIFGNQDKAGRVWVRLLNSPRGKGFNRNDFSEEELYLLGVARKNSFFEDGEKFTLHIYTPERYKRLIDFLVKFAFSFGNLGYRARKGFGSMNFINMEVNIKDLIDREKILDLLKSSFEEKKFSFGQNKEFPNLSNAVFLWKSGSGRKELSKFAQEYKNFRKTLNGKTYEYTSFIGNMLRRREFDKPEVRNAIFGLPINFSNRQVQCKKGRKTIKAQVQLNWFSEDIKENNRRPAPFWISFKRDKVLAVLFEAKFLPEDAKLVAKPIEKYWRECPGAGKPPKPVKVSFFRADYSLVEDFFKRLGFQEV